jgi:hypothetical protein
MLAKGTACLALTAAAAGLCAALAGCAGGGGAHAHAAGSLAATRQAAIRQAGSQRPGHAPGSAGASAAGAAARNGTASAQAARPAGASRGPAGRQTVTARLTSGLYTDGPDGTPHYVLSFAASAGSASAGSASAGSALKGSVSFLYQDGRIATVGSYAGTLSGSGTITLALADGRAMSGSYADGHLNLAGCAATLPMAKVTGGCTFTYHGHIP